MECRKSRVMISWFFKKTKIKKPIAFLPKNLYLKTATLINKTFFQLFEQFHFSGKKFSKINNCQIVNNFFPILALPSNRKYPIFSMTHKTDSNFNDFVLMSPYIFLTPLMFLKNQACW